MIVAGQSLFSYKCDDIGGYDDTNKRNDRGTKNILE